METVSLTSQGVATTTAATVSVPYWEAPEDKWWPTKRKRKWKIHLQHPRDMTKCII